MNGEARVTHRRRGARAVVFGLVWPLLSLLISVAVLKNLPSRPHGPIALALVLGIMGSGVAAAAGVWARSRNQRRTWSVTGTELVLGDKRIPRADIDSGMVLNRREGAQIDLRLADGELLQLDFTSRAEAEEALESLALDAARRRVRVVLNTPAETLGITAAGGLLGLLAWLPFAGIAGDVMGKYGVSNSFQTALAFATLIPLMIAGGLFIRSLTPEITIGAEGLAWRAQGWGQKRKTLGFDQVKSIGTHLRAGVKSAKHWAIEVGLQDGTTQTLGVLGELRQAEADAIIQRAQTALDTWRRGEASGSQAAQLDRTGATVRDWIAKLQQLALQKDGYRSTALTVERLVEVVSDPKASTEQRLGAAMVLSARGEESSREQIRIAGDTSVSPKLRVALDTIARAEADEQAIQEALDEESPRAAGATA